MTLVLLVLTLRMRAVLRDAERRNPFRQFFRP